MNTEEIKAEIEALKTKRKHDDGDICTCGDPNWTSDGQRLKYLEVLLKSLDK
jgi:hypothetical protein